MFSESPIVRTVLPFVAIAATLAWAGTAKASLVVLPDGKADFGLQFKIATDDLGAPNLLLFVTNVYVRFSEADDRLVSIGSSQMQTQNGSNFYQHAFGGNTAPNSVLVAAFPSLAFDTFVTIGVKQNIGGNTDTTATDANFSMGLNKISGGWSHTVAAGQGDAINGILKADGNYWILIAQLTVENKPGNSAFGSMLVFWQEAVGQPEQNNFGEFGIPSPGALALFGLAGLFGPRRRRR